MVVFRFLAPLLVLVPLAAHAQSAPLTMDGRIVNPGSTVTFETTEGTFRVALFTEKAPRLTRAFLDRVEEGVFRKEGFWMTRAEGIQVGTPATDVVHAAAREIFSESPGARPMRDAVNIPFLATLGAHGFEFTGLSPTEGSFMVDQRFIVGGQLLRREYFVALRSGFRRGEVVGHVVEGLDVVRRLDSRDGILRVSVD